MSILSTTAPISFKSHKSSLVIFPLFIDCISNIASCNSSFIVAFSYSFATLFAFPNNPLPVKADIDNPANINKIIIVITSAISVIPLFLHSSIFIFNFFCIFLSSFL